MRRALQTVAGLGCVLAVACALAPAALAAPDPATVDCTTHNHLTKQYTAAELRHALATLSADVKEYTSCPDILQRALDARLGNLHASGGGGGGSSFLPTPVLVVLILLILAGAGFGGLALRRRAEAGGETAPGSGTAGEQPTAETQIARGGEQPTEVIEPPDGEHEPPGGERRP